MGRYEDELRGIVTAESWSIPELRNLVEALESLVRAVPIALQPEGFTGKAAEEAKRTADSVSSQFGQIADLLAHTDRVIQNANRARDRAAAQLGELPSARVDQFWVNAATVASVVTFRGLELPAKGAIQFIESAMAQDREAKAQQALKDLQMERHEQEIRAARKDLKVFAPEIDVFDDPVDDGVGPDPGQDAPAWPRSGGSHHAGGSGGVRLPGTSVPSPGQVVVDGGSGAPGNDTGTSGSGGRGPSVDGGTGGSFPGGASGGAGGGFTPGGTGGGLIPGLLGGGAGAAALGVGSKLATSGFAGVGGGGVVPGGMGAGGTGGLGAGAGAGAAGRIGSGGLLGSQGAATGGASAASGSSAGSAAAGGRGGAGMMGGGMGGGAASEKEKRSGLGGLMAPKLEDEQDAAPRSAGAGAGGRTKSTE